MAKTSALGYITAARQTAGLGTPRSVSAKAWTSSPAGKFFRYLSAPKASAEMTNNRFREGGGKRDVSLSLKEGLAHNVSFPVFARPTVMAFLMAAATGPATLGGDVGGGTMSNGLVRPPKAKSGTAKITTVSAVMTPTSGSCNLRVASSSDFAASGDKIAIGWGANLEFATTTGKTTGVLIIDSLKYPHCVGEPVYEVKGYATVASAAIAAGDAAFTLSGSHGFSSGDKLAIVGMTTAGYYGSEIGNAEEFTATTISTNAVSGISPALSNGHSIGCRIYEYDDDSTTPGATRVHMFEPVNSLGAALDYYTIERAVGSDIAERIQDTKLGQFEITGEAPGALRLTTNWLGRFAKTYQKTAGPMTEVYTNQDPTVDLPFRMPNGKYVIQIGSSTNMSDKMKQFNFNASNLIAEDIYTNQIYRDELLDLAREANFGAQFYFYDKSEYMETYYGDDDPVDGTAPSSVATSAAILMEFSISATCRMNILIPNLTWESFPVEIDPEPKPIIVDGAGVPLASGSRPLYVVAIQNKDTGIY